MKAEDFMPKPGKVPPVSATQSIQEAIYDAIEESGLTATREDSRALYEQIERAIAVYMASLTSDDLKRLAAQLATVAILSHKGRMPKADLHLFASIHQALGGHPLGPTKEPTR